MNEKKYNILVTINDRYTEYLLVMLTSLFLNNKVSFSIFCLHINLREENKGKIKRLIYKNGHEISFLQVDPSVYKNFPVNENLTIECYLILLAHLILPSDLNKILYLDSDLIVEGCIEEFYHTDFEDNYMVACGQTHQPIEGNYYRSNANPAKGELFNTGVILFNLQKFRENVNEDTYLKAAQKENYRFDLADQGILNIVFSNKTKCISTLKYNFRIGIYEEFIRNTNGDLESAPIIIHFVMRDYYGINYISKPWKLTLIKPEYNLLVLAGIIKKDVELNKVYDMVSYIHDRWWHYAKMTDEYEVLKERMNVEKKRLLCNLLHNPLIQIAEWQNKIRLFKDIGKGCFNKNVNSYKSMTYGDLEKYTDSLESEKAIKIIRKLFSWNCKRLQQERCVRIAFIVYSSAEWQCEELYREFEKDGRFDPVIVVCGYLHGAEEFVRNTYKETCKYFNRGKTKYKIEYAGYCNRYCKNRMLDKFDIVVYISPYSSMCPEEINFSYRNVTQLCIHIPYGYYLVSRGMNEYKSAFYNQIIFKLSWFYFCPNRLYKEKMEKTHRLKAYNVEASGFPKTDALIKHTFLIRDKLWKEDKDSKLKLIWAPHFNLQEGMNGTFHENYKWFYQFAKEHNEIAWIVRPHPRMEWGVQEHGLFHSGKEYREYIDLWNSLPNASVIEGGGYYDIFDTSDAMITDSVSFLIEYQYTGKPLLLLRPRKPRALGALGELLMDVLYKCRGNDYNSIATFMENMKSGLDYNKKRRNDFREKYLNYINETGLTATEYIYSCVVNGIYR